MNRLLFLICLWLAYWGGLEGRAWEMSLPGRGVVERGLGTVPSEEAALVALERMAGHEMLLLAGNFGAAKGNSGCWIDPVANPAPIAGIFPPHSKMLFRA